LPDWGAANLAECIWAVFPEDGSVLAWNGNSARVMAEIMK